MSNGSGPSKMEAKFKVKLSLSSDRVEEYKIEEKMTLEKMTEAVKADSYVRDRQNRMWAVLLTNETPALHELLAAGSMFVHYTMPGAAGDRDGDGDGSGDSAVARGHKRPCLEVNVKRGVGVAIAGIFLSLGGADALVKEAECLPAALTKQDVAASVELLKPNIHGASPPQLIAMLSLAVMLQRGVKDDHKDAFEGGENLSAEQSQSLMTIINSARAAALQRTTTDNGRKLDTVLGILNARNSAHLEAPSTPLAGGAAAGGLTQKLERK